MKTFKRWTKRAFYSCLLVLATLGGLQLLPSQPDSHITSSLIGSRLAAAQELTTTKYHYQNTSSFDESKDFHGLKLPFTTKEIVLSYDGLIHAGIHMEEVGIQVEDSTIYLTLPESQILAHEIDPDSIHVLHEKSPWFNQIQVEDITTLASSRQADSEAQAIENGLLDEADQLTRQSIQDFLSKDPDILEHYTIEFK